MAGVVQLCEFLHLVVAHLALRLQIRLISRYRQSDPLGRVLLQLAHPFLHLLETLAGSYFVGHNGSQSLPVVNRRDRVVFFLASSVLHNTTNTHMASLTGCLLSSNIFFSR